MYRLRIYIVEYLQCIIRVETRRVDVGEKKGGHEECENSPESGEKWPNSHRQKGLLWYIWVLLNITRLETSSVSPPRRRRRYGYWAILAYGIFPPQAGFSLFFLSFAPVFFCYFTDGPWPYGRCSFSIMPPITLPRILTTVLTVAVAISSEQRHFVHNILCFLSRRNAELFV